MNTLQMNEIKPGMVVVFVNHSLNDHPQCWVDVPHETNASAVSGKTAMVVAVDPNAPGKQVAVCFKDAIANGHSCDGRVPHGHGAYVLAEHLYTPEAHLAHTASHDQVHVAQKAINDLLKGFVTP